MAVAVTGRIVVGVDGSEGSRRALAWALEEAAVRGSVVEAVVVWQSPYDLARNIEFSYPVDEGRLVERASERLTVAVAETVAETAAETAAVEVEPIVLEGDPAEALCARAAEADMLVVGSHGRGPVSGLLIGSVGTACAQHCLRPVVIVPSRRLMEAPATPAPA